MVAPQHPPVPGEHARIPDFQLDRIGHLAIHHLRKLALPIYYTHWREVIRTARPTRSPLPRYLKREAKLLNP